MKKFTNVEARVTGYMGESQRDPGYSRGDTYSSVDKSVPNNKKTSAISNAGSQIMMDGKPTKAQQMRAQMAMNQGLAQGKENKEMNSYL